MLENFIFSRVKKLIPRVSPTELIALRSGTASIDRDIFKGVVNYPTKEQSLKYQNYEPKFDVEKINELLKKYGKYQQVFPNEKSEEILDYVGKNHFFSFIIKERYGGKNLSISELSSVLTRISSCNPALGVITMVPNSLGPGELLQHYGTKKQKDMYLPKLSNGELIPCFGLTGPHNGSDATGSIDEGEVVLNESGEPIIRVTINKRYITLGPVSNLIGIAFRVKDPINAVIEKMSKKEEFDGSGNGPYEGVTLALLEKGHPGLEQLTHHNPLNVGFPNGTLKGTIDVPLDSIIGGKEKMGHGWKMLMECLAAGRGICLPATAKATSNIATVSMIQYAKHRTQFKLPLIKMEGIQEKLVDMLYNTWLINTSIDLTNILLDRGDKPAVISAIMKQQTTERARNVLNHGMDIHSGSAICLGENNILEKFYRAAPVGITVEGSNTLTRSLIIFGQGLNKSHPHIFDVMESILKNDKDNFSKNFSYVVLHTIEMFLNSLIKFRYSTELEKQTIEFANLANFVSLKGGALKGEQMLSGSMADIFSNLYLAHSVKWHSETFNSNKTISKYCIDRLMEENKEHFNNVINNMGGLKYLLYFSKKTGSIRSFRKDKEFLTEALKDKSVIDLLIKDIDIEHGPLKDLILLDNQEKESYKELYNKVIQVGEYNN